jgi:hypothetical protein
VRSLKFPHGLLQVSSRRSEEVAACAAKGRSVATAKQSPVEPDFHAYARKNRVFCHNQAREEHSKTRAEGIPVDAYTDATKLLNFAAVLLGSFRIVSTVTNLQQRDGRFCESSARSETQDPLNYGPSARTGSNAVQESPALLFC